MAKLPWATAQQPQPLFPATQQLRGISYMYWISWALWEVGAWVSESLLTKYVSISLKLFSGWQTPPSSPVTDTIWIFRDWKSSFLPFITWQNQQATLRACTSNTIPNWVQSGALETEMICVQGDRTFCKTNKQIIEQTNSLRWHILVSKWVTQTESTEV